MKSRVVLFPQAFKAEIAEIEIPALKRGEVLTKTIFTGVSTGTETRVFSGKQNGGVFPLVPGYENVGEVVDTGPAAKIRKGVKVFLKSSTFTGPYTNCWGGQVEYAVVPMKEIFPLSPGIDLLAATFGHTSAIAYHGIMRASVARGDKVAVVGQGLIGSLAALCAKALGAVVIVVDTVEERLAAAKKAGIDHVVNAAKENAEAAVKELSSGGVDVAVDATGLASTIDGTGRLVRMKPWDPPYPPSSRIVLLGSPQDPVVFSYYPTLFTNEPVIFPSRDCTADDITAVLKLISSGKLNPLGIPHKVIEVGDCQAAYDDLVNRRAMRIMFRW